MQTTLSFLFLLVFALCFAQEIEFQDPNYFENSENGFDDFLALPSLFINCGWILESVDSANNVWRADSFEVSTGTASLLTTNFITIGNDIEAGDFELLYQNARVSNSPEATIEYSIPLTEFGASGQDGVFNVALYFAELEYEASGLRVMQVLVENSIKEEALDIYQSSGSGAGASNTAFVLEIDDVVVRDGFLDIKLIATQGDALLAGISAQQASDHFAHAVISTNVSNIVIFEDLNNAGSVTKALDGTRSHTHYPDAGVTSWEWNWFGTASDGTYVDATASGVTPTVTIPTGEYVVTLSIEDTFSFSDSIAAYLNVLPTDGYEGCLAYYYDLSALGPLQTMPDFSLYAADTRIEGEVGGINFDLSYGDVSFGSSGLFADFGAVFICYLDISDAEAGNYQLSLESNDAAKLFIDDDAAPALQVTGVQGSDSLQKTSTSYNLAAGRHEIELQYFDSSSSPAKGLKLLWTHPGAVDEVVVPAERLFYALDQRLSVITSIFPKEGSVNGGSTITLDGYDFLTWDPSDVTILIQIVGRSDIIIDGVDVTRVSSERVLFVMPELPGDQTQMTIARISMITPAGSSNVVEFTYDPNAFDAPAWRSRQTLLNTADKLGFVTVEFGPDGKLYASNRNGTLFRWELSFNPSNWQYTIVPNSKKVSFAIRDLFSADEAQKLAILGLAFNPNDEVMGDDGMGPILYVSVSILFHGEIENDKLGWIYKVSGANMDNTEVVVSGLPVSDHDHGINGITFHPNGVMYVSVGGNTNTGVPGALSSTGEQEEKYYSACMVGINLYDDNFNGTLIYDENQFPLSFTNGIFVHAAGLRNSYDSVYMHKFDSIYATDNGPNQDFGNELENCTDTMESVSGSRWDKLVKADADDYFGSPNKLRAEISGTVGSGWERECTYVDLEEDYFPGWEKQISSFQPSVNGIIVYDVNTFGGQWKDSIIASSLYRRALRVILDQDGTGQIFNAQLPGTNYHRGLDITLDPRGTIFLADFQGDRMDYLAPNDNTNQYQNLYILSVFPNMGPITGGRSITIRGYNFGSISDTTVTFGAIDGPECHISSIESLDVTDAIICTTPDFSSFGSYGPVKMFIRSNEETAVTTHDYAFVAKLSYTPKIGKTGWIRRKVLSDTIKFFTAAAVQDVSESEGLYMWGGRWPAGNGLYGKMYYYEYDTDTWSELAKTPWYARGAKQTVQTVGTSFFMFGGDGPKSHFIRKFDTTNGWERLAKLEDNLNGVSTAWKAVGAFSGMTKNNVMFLAGGVVNGVTTDKVFCYDTSSNSAPENVNTPLPAPRSEAMALIFNDVFYVLGGYDELGVPQKTVYSLDLDTTSDPLDLEQVWVAREDLPYATAAGGVVEMDGKIVVIGGVDINNNALEVVQVFDPEEMDPSKAWKIESDMLTGRFGSAVVKDGNTVHVLGGGSKLNNAEASPDHQLMVFF